MTLETTSQFRKDYKRIKRRGYDMSQLAAVLDALLSGAQLPPRYRDHQLSGNMKDYRECHIQADWLLMYRISADRLILVANRTGTHADMFDE